MDVIIDVILAEAMVPRAEGAVAELQLRVIRIRAAADSALVIVELGGLRGMARRRSPPQKMKKFSIATTGSRFTGKELVTTDRTKNIASTSASHFILTGMMKNSSTCISGKSAAKEKNIERYTYSAVTPMLMPVAK